MSQRVSRAVRLSRAENEMSSIATSTMVSTPNQKPSVNIVQRVLCGQRKLNHVALSLQLSLTTNTLIVVIMTGIAISSKSLALLSALVENMVDLFVQALLWYAGTRAGKKQDHAKFPAGTSRFEPVAVIIASSVMMFVSILFIQEASSKLVDGFAHSKPVAPILAPEGIIIGSVAVVTKIGLYCYGGWVLKTHTSAAVEAIMDDNRNDAVSNAFAIVAYIVASTRPELWYVDPAGAIVIFLLIMVSWARMGKEQVMQLVGVSATDSFITEVKRLCQHHNENLSLDIVRAYHFGSKYLVELEVVVPANMTVKDAHDIALQLQFKVENLEDVERAFVHVDYQAREYDEHIVSREEDAIVMYAGGETPAYEAVSMHEEEEDKYSEPRTDGGGVGAVAEGGTLVVDIQDAEVEPTTDYESMKI